MATGNEPCLLPLASQVQQLTQTAPFGRMRNDQQASMGACHSCIVLPGLTVMHCVRQGVDWEEASDLKAVAAEVDVLYQTRIQKERFQVWAPLTCLACCWRGLQPSLYWVPAGYSNCQQEC